MPDWPADGVADAEWVEQALEWRLSKGVDDCGQEMLALDALALEWLSKSQEIQVEIRTEDWPFLAFSPELTAPLTRNFLEAQAGFDAIVAQTEKQRSA